MGIQLHKFLPLLSLLFLISCATSGQMGTIFSGTISALETDTKPQSIFIEKKITSLSVMNFDAKGVKTYRGQILDYVEVGNDFTDDLIRAFYEGGRVRVTIGEHIENVVITDSVGKTIGDENNKVSTLTRMVTYKAAPFRRVDAILEGRILKFNPEAKFEDSFIEVYLKLTDTYDGSVYWITRMRGRAKNVINTIVESVTTGAYAEVIKTEGEGQAQ